MGYLIIITIVTLAIYPVIGHWVWGGHFAQSTVGWLEKSGFTDFAGATVVHVTGGAVALAALVIIGARKGRFDSGSSNFRGQSMVTSIVGVLFLWVGWFGFNGGNSFLQQELLPVILVNTALAGAAGGCSVLILSLFLSSRVNVLNVGNGILAGLVSVTAGCHILTLEAAVLVGMISGLIVLLLPALLERVNWMMRLAQFLSISVVGSGAQ
ncbi:hypothetical protein EOPP23_12410 [Endozoicomonas sp. OPT23]|nr:hypothetical protein [Endozoicomonas sp. OPT23]